MYAEQNGGGKSFSTDVAERNEQRGGVGMPDELSFEPEPIDFPPDYFDDQPAPDMEVEHMTDEQMTYALARYHEDRQQRVKHRVALALGVKPADATFGVTCYRGPNPKRPCALVIVGLPIGVVEACGANYDEAGKAAIEEVQRVERLNNSVMTGAEFEQHHAALAGAGLEQLLADVA